MLGPLVIFHDNQNFPVTVAGIDRGQSPAGGRLWRLPAMLRRSGYAKAQPAGRYNGILN